MGPSKFLLSVGFPFLLLLWAGPVEAQLPDSSGAPVKANSHAETKEAPYVPTPQHVVRRMLETAGVGADDVVYDLGSGDGRIVVTAAQEFGARGVGIEIDPELIERARRNAEQAGVADQVEFRRGDLFEADITEATVVTLYLWPTMNNRLRPKLRDELAPGTHVLSHEFGIDGWTPDTTLSMGSDSMGNFIHQSASRVYVWTIPAQ